ncbi:MAG: NAD(P)H-dependent oxidoreductase [Eubacterium sp.]|nr:NAD(P)H-dependent oxidoreductase [Eubacterium sp.]
MDSDIKEVRLEDIEFPLVNEEFIDRREELKNAGKYDDDMFLLARDFRDADEIVIAAPYYDLSFPAMLKHLQIHSMRLRMSERSRQKDWI